jgi:hypothetical protein
MVQTTADDYWQWHTIVTLCVTGFVCGGVHLLKVLAPQDMPCR